MPWTVKDVDGFKKGLSPAQKRKWVRVANGALRSCQAKGGKNCEASAIKIANSKFKQGAITMEDKLPKGALRFVAEGCHAVIQMTDTGELADGKPVKKPSLKMVGYSGGVIKGHWYWDDLVIDLDGVKFNESRYPILEDHNTSRKIAHIGKPVIEEGKLKAPDDAVFMNNEASREFIENSQAGFPYQSSIYAKPSNVERLEEGAKAEVNGFTLKGPASIWRKCEFKEMSVCVFGWDSQTQASAFSRDVMEDCQFTEEHISAEKKKLIKRRKEVNGMDLEELKKDHPDLVAQIAADAAKAAEAKFAKEKTALTEELEIVKSDLKAQMETVSALKANDEKRSELDMANAADVIWTRKLAQSDLPERLYDKVRKHVRYHGFVGEDGRFDSDAFGKAVDAEIEDWADVTVTSDNDVEGEGFTEKDLETQNKLTEENKDLTERLLKHAGHKPKTD